MRDTIRIEDEFYHIDKGVFVTFGADEYERDLLRTLAEVDLIFPDGTTRRSQILSCGAVGRYDFIRAAGMRNVGVQLAGIHSLDDIPHHTHLRFRKPA